MDVEALQACAANEQRSLSIDVFEGFFADINLDHRVDDQDLSEFRFNYRTGPNDPVYNPDYNFSDDSVGIIDIREFGKFSKEYGRTDVQ